MGKDGGVARALGHLDGGQGLGQGADLVDLDQDGVGRAEADAAVEAIGVGDEEVVADQLHALAEALGELGPAVPVVFGHAVLDREDGVAVDEVLEVIDHLVGGADDAFTLEVVLAVAVELGRGDVEGEHDVSARGVAGGLDGIHDDREGVVGRVDLGRIAALVADGGVQAAGLEDLLERMEDLRAAAQGLGEGGRADGHDHELLDVDRVVGMGAAVDDVEHRNGKGTGRDAADVAVERHVDGVGGRLGNGQRDAEDGVGAKLGLVGGAVQLEHRLVDGDLVEGVHAGEFVGDHFVDVVDGAQDALAVVPIGLVLVAHLDGFVGAGGGAGGNGRAAARSAGQDDVDLDGGIAAGVEDLAGIDVFNERRHWGVLLSTMRVGQKISRSRRRLR
ncbi:hypothetical protein D3C86_773940 [compost metagenome]